MDAPQKPKKQSERLLEHVERYANSESDRQELAEYIEPLDHNSAFWLGRAWNFAESGRTSIPVLDFLKAVRSLEPLQMVCVAAALPMINSDELDDFANEVRYRSQGWCRSITHTAQDAMRLQNPEIFRKAVALNGTRLTLAEVLIAPCDDTEVAIGVLDACASLPIQVIDIVEPILKKVQPPARAFFFQQVPQFVNSELGRYPEKWSAYFALYTNMAATVKDAFEHEKLASEILALTKADFDTLSELIPRQPHEARHRCLQELATLRAAEPDNPELRDEWGLRRRQFFRVAQQVQDSATRDWLLQLITEPKGDLLAEAIEKRLGVLRQDLVQLALTEFAGSPIDVVTVFLYLANNYDLYGKHNMATKARAAIQEFRADIESIDPKTRTQLLELLHDYNIYNAHSSNKHRQCFYLIDHLKKLSDAQRALYLIICESIQEKAKVDQVFERLRTLDETSARQALEQVKTIPVRLQFLWLMEGFDLSLNQLEVYAAIPRDNSIAKRVRNFTTKLSDDDAKSLRADLLNIHEALRGEFITQTEGYEPLVRHAYAKILQKLPPGSSGSELREAVPLILEMLDIELAVGLGEAVKASSGDETVKLVTTVANALGADSSLEPTIEYALRGLGRAAIQADTVEKSQRLDEQSR